MTLKICFCIFFGEPSCEEDVSELQKLSALSGIMGLLGSEQGMLMVSTFYFLVFFVQPFIARSFILGHGDVQSRSLIGSLGLVP